MKHEETDNTPGLVWKSISFPTYRKRTSFVSSRKQRLQVHARDYSLFRRLFHSAHSSYQWGFKRRQLVFVEWYTFSEGCFQMPLYIYYIPFHSEFPVFLILWSFRERLGILGICRYRKLIYSWIANVIETPRRKIARVVRTPLLA